MKLKIILLILLFLINLIYPTMALPVIENFTITPQSLWLGETTNVSFYCYNETNTTMTTYGKLEGPNMSTTIEFSNTGNHFTKEIQYSYLKRIGNYLLTIFCSENNVTENETNIFNVSRFDVEISNITNPSYIGDEIEILADIRINDKPIEYSLEKNNFNVSLNNKEKELNMNPIYDSNLKKQILRIDAPDITGTYLVNVNAMYDRASDSDSSTIDIKKDMEFEITGIEPSNVEPNDNIVITLKAVDKGDTIPIHIDNIEFQIDDSHIESSEIEENKFTIIAPNIASGRHKLKAILNYNNYSYQTPLKNIDYIVPLSGKFLDVTGKPMNVHIEFYLDNYKIKTFNTDSVGSYSGQITPNIYDIKFSFPYSDMTLHDAVVNNFNNPIHYEFFNDVTEHGIDVYGVYVVESAIPFSLATVEIPYNERRVDDESELRLFKCSQWIASKNTCKNNWIEMNAEIDTVRNIAKFTTSTLSAFVLGTKEKLLMSMNKDKN